jgi:ligand-binding sensor domain-containing protein
MFFKKIIFLLTVCFAYCFSFAQPAKNISLENNYQCIAWGTDQGLSVGGITAMLKDSNGFLWIGTDIALNRFDGSRFINYFPDINKRGTINSGNIRGLILDSLGNIWIGTSMGLSRYDNKNDTFSNFSSPFNPDLNFAFIIPFWATHDEVFCIEMSSQITAYNIYSCKKRIVVNHFENDLGNEFIKYCYSILDTRNNCIWILENGGLLEVSLISGKQNHYKPGKDTKSGDYMDGGYISAMCYDQKRRLIWLNTYDGLGQFNVDNKRFTHLDAFKEILKKPHYWPVPGNRS